MRNIFYSIAIMSCSIFIVCATAQAFNFSPEEQYQYLKTTGSKRLYLNWQLIRENDLKLVTLLGNEEDTTRMHADLATSSWSVNDPVAGTDMIVVRENNQLVFNGTFKREKIQRHLKIDSAPWYQALSLSLRQFTDNNQDHIEFWSIRPDTLDLHRLQVIRVAEETLKLEGIESRAIKLKIQLTGLKAAFWSCYYWLRKTDGVFLRYEGPSGPPGWPLTTVELINPPSQVKLDQKVTRLIR